jgi:hypothetical protein
MKRLEGEVLEALLDLGGQEALRGLGGHTVDPHQFLGLRDQSARSISERAAAHQNNPSCGSSITSKSRSACCSTPAGFNACLFRSSEPMGASGNFSPCASAYRYADPGCKCPSAWRPVWDRGSPHRGAPKATPRTMSGDKFAKRRHDGECTPCMKAFAAVASGSIYNRIQNPSKDKTSWWYRSETGGALNSPDVDAKHRSNIFATDCNG